MAITTTADAVSDDLHRLRFLFVNVYFVRTGAGWVLIDAGLPAAAAAIQSTAADFVGADSAPTAIVLTHGHFDHVGALASLLERWDVPIYAHPIELPHLTGKRDYPPPDPLVGKGLMALASFVYPHKAADFGDRVRPLPKDGSVPPLPDWRWLHTPGHTDGHISLVRDADRCLIAGDAFVTVQQESIYDVARQEQEVHGPPSYFTPDWAAASRSVRSLLSLDPAIAATGHGTPMRGQALTDGLRSLVERFDEIAVPARHRDEVTEPMGQ